MKRRTWDDWTETVPKLNGRGTVTRPILSVRAINALDRFDTDEEITVSALLALKHIGRVTVKEIVAVFADHGIVLPKGDTAPHRYGRFGGHKQGLSLTVGEQEAAAEERAAIVAWLRALPPPWDERVDPETVTQYVADAIEAGKHRPSSL